jgi:predicted HTH transcriptional regulator
MNSYQHLSSNPLAMTTGDAHDAVRAIIILGDFDRLIGLAEDLYLEVKGSIPYDLSTPAGRFELAKDVSAFANSEGGHLLIGFTHERLPNARVDQIKGLQLFGSTAIDVLQIGGMVRTHVWPLIQGLTITWIPSKGDSDLGIVAVYVPVQSEESKPFLITKVVEESEPQKEIIVGIARRIGGENLPLRAQEIHDLIRKGRDPILQRTIRIEEKLDALSAREEAPQKGASDQGDVLAQRLKRMRDA